MNFSVCIIAKNEEKNLKETLSKLCYLLGKPGDGQYEILVLDTGSTDKTVEVALEFGGSVEHFEWIKDFSAARNAAMKVSLMQMKFPRISIFPRLLSCGKNIPMPSAELREEIFVITVMTGHVY